MAAPRFVTEYRREMEAVRLHGGGNEASCMGPFENLLNAVAAPLGMRIVREQPLRGAAGVVQPDGELRDRYHLRRGVWESKAPHTDLERELSAKLHRGYPTENLLVENGVRAVLVRDGRRAGTYDLSRDDELWEVVTRFVHYPEARYDAFHAAADEFTRDLPHISALLREVIERENEANPAFRRALEGFWAECVASVNRGTKREEVEDMLLQHLLTERIFSAVFQNRDLVFRNPIAGELQKVVNALAGRHLSTSELLAPLDRFYEAVEATARGLPVYAEKQRFLHTVYEIFFQRVNAGTADRHGIVYTPGEIATWMAASVEQVLWNEFDTTLGEPGVHVLDPCAGTGTFILELIRRIPPSRLPRKYERELHCNELLLLPYYIAAQSIEHAYYDMMAEYRPFPGICLTDSLERKEIPDQGFLTPENTQRIQAQDRAPIRVIIGNPPYNVGQRSENENNRNRDYLGLDGRIAETYGRASRASSTSKLYDMYVRFFRWATDRLEDDGVIAFVSNSSFLHQRAFDGMRRELLRDFTDIFVLDLGGNVRETPGISGTRHNVFRIQVGVAITLLVRKRRPGDEERARVWYAATGSHWTRRQKLRELAVVRPDHTKWEWTRLAPDASGNWLTHGMADDFGALLPLGSREAKEGVAGAADVVFRTYTLGVNTNRDAWVYNFSRERLLANVARLADTYNADVGRWIAAGRRGDADAFVTADETRIKWSSRLKEHFKAGRPVRIDETRVRRALYRPFSRQHLYYDPALVHRPGHWDTIFPTPESEAENVCICLTAPGSQKPFMVLATNAITDLHLVGAGAGTQCFPFYTYGADGERRDNVTEWALSRFRARYGEAVTRWDVFHYVYAVLHAPGYRARYAENLRRDLPAVPLAGDDDFARLVEAGARLVELHARYERAEPYPLQAEEDTPFSPRIDAMKLDPARGRLVINPSLTLTGIPQEAFEWTLGSRGALAWIVDQYRRHTERRSGITNDPTDMGGAAEVAELVRRVVPVAVETVRIVASLPAIGAEETAGEAEEKADAGEE